MYRRASLERATEAELRAQNRSRKPKVTILIVNSLVTTIRVMVAKVVALALSMTSEPRVDSLRDSKRPQAEKVKCHTNNSAAKITKLESLIRIERKTEGVTPLPSSDTSRSVASAKDITMRAE
jgi:hypothetical protein